jgi:hypothetical protein
VSSVRAPPPATSGDLGWIRFGVWVIPPCRKKALALVYRVSSVIVIAMQVLTEDRHTTEMLRTIGVMSVVCLFGTGCCRRDN